MAKNKVVNITIRLKDGVSRGLKSIGAGIMGITRRMLSLKTAVLGLAGAGGAFALLGKTIKTSFNFETMRTQLRVLLGSVSAAAKQFKVLRDFSAKTPFQLPGIVDAYQQLLTFTEGALATEEGLKLVGDAAAGRGKDFSEMAFWVGRLYSALKNGDPFLDSVGALQRMGVTLPTIRGDLNRLTETGASFGTKWAVVEKGLLQFTGGMELLAQTGDGLFSTLKDNWAIALATFGDEFQKAAKDGIGFMITKIQQLVSDGSITAWAKQAKEAFDTVVNTVKVLTSAKSDKDRADIAGAAGMVLKAAFIDASNAMVALLTHAAPVIGAMMGDAFNATLKRAVDSFAEKKDIEFNMGMQGKLPKATPLSRKNNAARAALVNEEYRKRRGTVEAEEKLVRDSELAKALKNTALPTALKNLSDVMERIADDVAPITDPVKEKTTTPGGFRTIGNVDPAVLAQISEVMAPIKRDNEAGMAAIMEKLSPKATTAATTTAGIIPFAGEEAQPGRGTLLRNSLIGARREWADPAGAIGQSLGESGGTGVGGVDAGEEIKRTNELLIEQNRILDERLGGVKGD